MLSLCSNGFGSLALLGLMGSKVFGNVISDSPMTPRPPHLVPKAKNIIFLYMDGGVSHVDTFDPKPLLDKENGQPFKMKIEPTQFNNNGGVLKKSLGVQSLRPEWYSRQRAVPSHSLMR